ncbi:DNA repair protein RecN [Hyphobacterium sp. CCMP332]|nr:DNA repair protein RecN [Hyphobacterium sp. CCMP332]
MLNSLRVKNYILIKELEINPDSSLVVITGETGAGKSIILGAIDLLMGARADTKTLFDADKKCVIEGLFNIKNYRLQNFFKENEWDYYDECIIRREINSAGRSRAFVNDSPANLNKVKELGEQLLDIHSQHESILVNNSKYQLSIIDAIAGNQKELNEFRSAFQKYSKVQSELNQLNAIREEDEKEKDYKSFLLKELDEASLEQDEKDKIENELQIAENAEQIHLQLGSFQQLMDLSEPGAMQILREAILAIQKIASYSNDYEELYKRLESAEIELKDILGESQNLLDQVDIDAEKLNELRERVNLIQRLEDKHHVKEFNELLEIQKALENDLGKSLNLETEIANLESSLAEIKSDIDEKAKVLSDSRKSVKDQLANEMVALLNNLGIEEAQIQIDITEKILSDDGIDQVNILFSANKGQKPVPLKEAASGGEMSRLMLVIKYLIADKTSLPTIIFDEIDTGISGKIAIQMGEMFKKIALEHQVLAITHLPQIAAKGNRHFVVFKETGDQKTSTEIRELSGEERIIEIAQMISGKSDSSSAIASAKELLEHKKL